MILIVAAMQSEVELIIKNHAFKLLDQDKDLYLFTHVNNQFLLKITGVGKVNAAYGMTSVICKYNIDKIYNIGFAGASKRYHQSEIVYVHQSRYHDFDLSIFGYEKGQVPNHPVYFLSDDKLLAQAEQKLPKRKSTLYTGDVFMTESASDDFLVDMEGTALYHIAHNHLLPILSIKVVSDIIGMDNHIESYQAFEAKKGASILNDVFEKLILEV
jgi:adenosylhomocysteine nucleosidase